MLSRRSSSGAGLRACRRSTTWSMHSDSAATRTPSSGRGLKDLFHVAVRRGGGLLRTAAILTGAQVGCVPVRPAVLGVRLLVAVVVLRCFAAEFCKSCDVHGSCSRRLPHAAWKPRLDLLEQPAVPVRILERGEREVGTTLRVTPADAWVLHGVIARDRQRNGKTSLTSTPRAIK